MKKRTTPSTTAKDPKKSAVAHHLGGQPENDEDAQAAGFKSATSDEKKAPRKKN